MKVGIGSDHAGVELKPVIKKYLEDRGYSVEDFGTNSTDSCDYPDYVHPLADAIEAGDLDMGVVICGSANGVSMTANKHQGIRAALSWLPEIASLGRQHNDANVLALPARYLSDEEAVMITKAFFDAEFEGGRHQRRVDKIKLS